MGPKMKAKEGEIESVTAVAVPLVELRPAPWNPRSITEERFQNLCDSIRADPDFLWHRPVLAQADGTIYAGNMRYRAAQHLGMETVPALVEDVSDRLARERALRDPRLDQRLKLAPSLPVPVWLRQQEAELGNPLSGFNPLPPRRTRDTTASGTCTVVLRFQSAPAPKDERYRQCDVDYVWAAQVSIRSRPEGREIPGQRNERVQVGWQVSIRSRPEGREILVVLGFLGVGHIVSIRSRPEGREILARTNPPPST